MKIFHDKTDEQNPLTINEIIAELDIYGIKAERKSIYTDFEILRQFGLEIEMARRKTTGYYLAQRRFELGDLKLLVDAVQSVDFISEEKSAELISKLFSLTNIEQVKILEDLRQDECDENEDVDAE